MNIIGILGKAGSGKDTTADILVNDFNYSKISFADPLKRFCKDVFEFTDEQLWGSSEYRNAEDTRWLRQENPDSKYLTPRYALQQLGTSWGRDCHPDIWVTYAIRKAEKLLSSPIYRYSQKQGVYSVLADEYDTDSSEPPAGVVIADCRFVNEVNAIKEKGGKVFKVVRDSGGLHGAASAHLSETEQESISDDYFDHIIDNNGSIDDLKKIIKNLLK